MSWLNETEFMCDFDGENYPFKEMKFSYYICTEKNGIRIRQLRIVSEKADNSYKTSLERITKENEGCSYISRPLSDYHACGNIIAFLTHFISDRLHGVGCSIPNDELSNWVEILRRLTIKGYEKARHLMDASNSDSTDNFTFSEDNIADFLKDIEE